LGLLLFHLSKALLLGATHQKSLSGRYNVG